jgi:UDPglucose 6-dehydrogenase
MKAGMGDGGACHPRDNIALRHMASELDLGYDLFDAIMNSREIQAKNLAKFLVNQSENSIGLPIYIHGKAYKPDVEYLDGSYSLLIGHYIQEMGHDVQYIDPLTGDDVASAKGVILLAHNKKVTYEYRGFEEKQNFYCDIESGSIIVDPWRTTPDIEGCKVIHYGNTR